MKLLPKKDNEKLDETSFTDAEGEKCADRGLLAESKVGSAEEEKNGFSSPGHPFDPVLDLEDAQTKLFGLFACSLSPDDKIKFDALRHELGLISASFKKGDLETKSKTLNTKVIKSGLQALNQLLNSKRHSEKATALAKDIYVGLLRTLSTHPYLLPLVKDPAAVSHSFNLVDLKVNEKKKWTGVEARGALVTDLFRDRRNVYINGLGSQKVKNLNDLYVDYVKQRFGEKSDKIQSEQVFNEFLGTQLKEIARELKTQMPSKDSLKDLNVQFEDGTDHHENAALYLMYLLTQQTWATPTVEVTRDTLTKNKGIGVSFKNNWSFLDLYSLQVKRFGVATITQEDQGGNYSYKLSPELTEINANCKPIDKCNHGEFSFHHL